jgi:hypothetical protein
MKTSLVVGTLGFLTSAFPGAFILLIILLNTITWRHGRRYGTFVHCFHPHKQQCSFSSRHQQSRLPATLADHFVVQYPHLGTKRLGRACFPSPCVIKWAASSAASTNSWSSWILREELVNFHSLRLLMAVKAFLLIVSLLRYAVLVLHALACLQLEPGTIVLTVWFGRSEVMMKGSTWLSFLSQCVRDLKARNDDLLPSAKGQRLFSMWCALADFY